MSFQNTSIFLPTPLRLLTLKGDGEKTIRSFWSRVDPTRPRPCPAAIAVSRSARRDAQFAYEPPLCARIQGELRDTLWAWFPRTGDRNCVTIIDSPPRNARSAGAREARRHRAWGLAVGTRSKRALREEVRTAVAASQRWYPALVCDLFFWRIKSNLLLSWRSHSTIVRHLFKMRQWEMVSVDVNGAVS